MKNIFSIVCLIILFPVLSHAAPKSEYWDIWDQSDENSTEVIDHSFWQEILDQYVIAYDDDINRVAYQRLLDSDRGKLETYLSSLTSLDPLAYNRNEQLAYWINLYNALTIKVILDHYPEDSILDISISPGFFNFGPWDKKLISINGTELSLNDIEHRILRPIWKDPRIHYAVNCASIGCPNLRKQVYTHENADEMLTQNAISYINHPRGVRVRKGKVKLSTIFKWYKKDFGKKDSAILNHIRQYASDELLEELKEVKRISGYGYDWDLNDAK